MPIKTIPPPCQLLEPEKADAKHENNALQQVNTQVSVNYAISSLILMRRSMQQMRTHLMNMMTQYLMKTL